MGGEKKQKKTAKQLAFLVLVLFQYLIILIKGVILLKQVLFNATAFGL
jgi:hypothetical protein